MLRNERGPSRGELSIPSALVNEAAQPFFFVLFTLILADGLCTDVLTDDASNPSLQDGA